MKASTSRRMFFVAVTAWMSLCLFVAGFFPNFGPLLSKTWLVTGAIGMVASFGMANSLSIEAQLNASTLREYELRSLTDPLTNLANRRGFDLQLNDVISYERKHRPTKERSIFLALIDVDNFKEINDEHGHPMGDRMLEFVAQSIYEMVPEQSVACRIGGDEFAVIYVDAPPELVAWSLKNIKIAIDHETVSRDDLIHTTISIGLTNLQTHDDYDVLMERADEALYKTKQAGRNKITFR